MKQLLKRFFKKNRPVITIHGGFSQDEYLSAFFSHPLVFDSQYIKHPCMITYCPGTGEVEIHLKELQQEPVLGLDEKPERIDWNKGTTNLTYKKFKAAMDFLNATGRR
jgi:hypothetical protein